LNSILYIQFIIWITNLGSALVHPQGVAHPSETETVQTSGL